MQQSNNQNINQKESKKKNSDAINLTTILIKLHSNMNLNYIKKDINI
jgi:hypothetical protein